MSDVEGIIQRIHDSQPQAVLAVAGAGNQSITWLLGVAGASRTLLEVLVPYGRLSMIGFLGHEPEQYVSSDTARKMAGAAYRRALALREDDAPQPLPVLGISCTATIATDRPKRGEHRAYVAAWDEAGCTTYGLLLNKGLRDRAGEDELVVGLRLNQREYRGPNAGDSRLVSSFPTGDAVPRSRLRGAAPLC